MLASAFFLFFFCLSFPFLPLLSFLDVLVSPICWIPILQAERRAAEEAAAAAAAEAARIAVEAAAAAERERQRQLEEQRERYHRRTLFNTPRPPPALKDI